MATRRPCTSPCPPPIWTPVLANEFCRIFSIPRFIFACTLSSALLRVLLVQARRAWGQEFFGGSKQDAWTHWRNALNTSRERNARVTPILFMHVLPSPMWMLVVQQLNESIQSGQKRCDCEYFMILGMYQKPNDPLITLK